MFVGRKVKREYIKSVCGRGRVALLTFLALAALIVLSGCFGGFAGLAGGMPSSSPDSRGLPVRSTAGGPKLSLGHRPMRFPEKDPIKERINEMTTDEKIGQMIMAGIEGTSVNSDTMTLIEKDKIGGVILFGQNINGAGQLLTLINTMKSVNRNQTPMFFSVDEEGGRVSRMPAGIKKLPANQKLGEIGSGVLSHRIGGILALLTGSFGFNMDIAPVLDVNSNPDNPVIGDRSFGPDEKEVAKLGVQTMKGIQEGGIIPVVKHFPGHGDTSVDSHVGLPSVGSDMDRLNSVELVPFRAAIENGADAVMVAHILMGKIDPQYPASMSYTVITDLLRKQMGFNGVAITDDMTMGAIMKNYDVGDAAVKSVAAGADIVLVCHGYENERAVIDSIKAAVSAGTIPMERIDESVYRILKLKSKYSLTNDMIPSINVDELNLKIDAVLIEYNLNG